MNFAQMGTAAAKTDSMARAVTAGRVLQDDTDFICYQCAHPDQTLKYALDKLLQNVEFARRQAGAERVNLHLTMGLKGGRAEMATVQPYQEKRNQARNPELQARVAELRSELANLDHPLFTPVVNTIQEADDSIRQYQWKMIQEHGVESSVIRSGDKDLWFAEGYHIDDQGRLYNVSGYGTTDYREVGNVKPKLIGRGTSWFWHQMIMGDSVDNIPGLPVIKGTLLNRYLPTKVYNAKRKDAACGEAKAVAMLKDVTTEQEAARRVLEAYQLYYGNTFGVEMLVEQAFLLWIRKTNKMTEVIEYLRSCGISCDFTADQKKRLKDFVEKAKAHK